MKELLLSLLLNAADNGYPMWDDDAMDIADDIMTYTNDFDEAGYDEVVKAIKTIQEEMNK